MNLKFCTLKQLVENCSCEGFGKTFEVSGQTARAIIGQIQLEIGG